jgi:hypothetical protein
MNAFREISSMADRINLPKTIVYRADNLFKQMHNGKNLKGRANDAIASACLYIACRQEGVPRTFKVCWLSTGTVSVFVISVFTYLFLPSPSFSLNLLIASVGVSDCVYCMFFTFGCCILLRIYPTGFLMMPSIATKFQYVSSPFFIFPSYSLHVSAPMGHPQVRYTIRCFRGLFLIQRIRCTYTTWHMPILVLRPVVPSTCYQT